MDDNHELENLNLIRLPCRMRVVKPREAEEDIDLPDEEDEAFSRVIKGMKREFENYEKAWERARLRNQAKPKPKY